MTSEVSQQRNLEYFEHELVRLLNDVAYKDKFVVINDGQIKGSYDSFELALSFAIGNFPANEFLIQQVIDQSEQINFIRSAVA